MARTVAAKCGIGLGEYVGKLVTEAAEQSTIPVPVTRNGDRHKLFARVAVESHVWSLFVASAHAQRLTAAVLVGAVVERAVGGG